MKCHHCYKELKKTEKLLCINCYNDWQEALTDEADRIGWDDFMNRYNLKENDL
jgi:protein-arginine kinase activator protein McsA